jgi:hypothetical protein
MILRVYWRLNGAHAYLRVFAGTDEFQNFRLAGNLVLSAAEFIALTQAHFQTEFYEEGVTRDDDPVAPN